MKNVEIRNVPKKITFDLKGSYSDLISIGKYLNEKPHLFVFISRYPHRVNSESTDYIMAIECPDATYGTVITLIQNFISE